jgi:eukaryotic-like serine/threonine-protein kinase
MGGSILVPGDRGVVMSARPLLDPPSVPAPQRLGKYDIVGVLGEGAMGIVYKAMDPHIHRPVAIKAIRAPLLGAGAQDISAAQRFRTEAQAAGRLTHPNIVSIYEFGEFGESGADRFIAMEYVDGVSLLELTGHGRRLPLNDVCSVMVQLLDALECAHEQGVWHRDIKPANLLITPDGRLKVTDFGIARIDSSDMTHQSTVLGSPGYMAPERYTDDAPDRRVDIFSCGVLFYELLTGTPPFRGNSSAVMYQVLHDEPPPPSTLAIDHPPPERFDAIVAQALAKRPGERFASAAQMRDALCEAAGRPIAPHVSLATMMRPRPGADDEAATQVLPRRAAASAPGSAGSVPMHDAALLKAIEGLLVGTLGPVARLVVRDVARRCPQPGTLVARIAAEALEPGDREAFLARAHALLPAQAAVPASGVPSKSLPVLGSTPMHPRVVERAQQILAEHIGPIAGLIVRRAAAAAGSREQFFTALADQAGAEADHKQLLAQLWKID